jgi:hypothetical protein
MKAGGLDEMEMLMRRKKKRRKIHESQNRGKMLAQASGTAHIRMPQSARLSLEMTMTRKDRLRRNNERLSRAAEIQDNAIREMGSKYSGEARVTEVHSNKKKKKKKKKKRILPKKFGVGRSHFIQSTNETRERSNEYERWLSSMTNGGERRADRRVEDATTLETELFAVAARLSATYHEEWSEWTTEVS